MITALVSVTLDGVAEAPETWAAPYNDAETGREASASHEHPTPVLFGRRTFEQFERSWGGRTDNPFSLYFDTAVKHVLSTTLPDDPGWTNARTLRDLDDVRAIEGDLIVFGSLTLVRALLAAGMLDVLRLSTYPLTLGSGARLFADGGPGVAMALETQSTTSTGVVVATYRPLSA